jgi:hypothetical protein
MTTFPGGFPDNPTSPVTAQGHAANVPDSFAVGTTISIATDTGGVVANYLSRSPQAESIARRIWAQASDRVTTSPVTTPQGVRISIPSTRQEARAMLLLVVFGVLGHAIFL